MPPRPAFATESSEGFAVASLVLSVLWLAGLGSLLAVVFGHLSRRRDRHAGARPNGLALAGLIIGYVGVFFVPVITAVAIPVFLAHREAARDAVLRFELRNAATAQEVWWVDGDGYATSLSDLEAAGYHPRPGVRVRVMQADVASYCLRARSTSGADVLFLSSGERVPTPSPCA